MQTVVKQPEVAVAYYTVKDVMGILGCKQTKAQDIIRQLNDEMEAKGYMRYNWFNEIIALNNQAESCKKLLKEERNKAIDDFYNKLLEASESAKPVGWPTMQEIVQMVYIKDIVEELKAGE